MEKTNNTAPVNQIEAAIADSENSETNKTPETTYSAENSDFNAMVGEATKTQVQRQNEAQADKKPKYMDEEKAQGLALGALGGLLKVSKIATGRKIKMEELDEDLVLMFVALTTPAIQKHGPKLIPKPGEIDMESWTPELMAIGGLACGGFAINGAKAPIEEQSDDNKEKGAKSGNK